MKKFVIVRFTDGDARVYTKRAANKRSLARWNGETRHLHAEVLAESADKDELIPMATLAREEYMSNDSLVPRDDNADYTKFGKFP